MAMTSWPTRSWQPQRSPDFQSSWRVGDAMPAASFRSGTRFSHGRERRRLHWSRAAAIMGVWSLVRGDFLFTPSRSCWPVRFSMWLSGYGRTAAQSGNGVEGPKSAVPHFSSTSRNIARIKIASANGVTGSDTTMCESHVQGLANATAATESLDATEVGRCAGGRGSEAGGCASRSASVAGAAGVASSVSRHAESEE